MGSMHEIDLHQSLATKQHQKLLATLAMQQAFLVLKLPILELSQWVENQIDANPILEKLQESSPNPIHFDQMEKLPSLYEHLMQQAHISGFTEEEILLAETLIGNFNEQGFLSSPLKDLGSPIRMLKKVLKKIQDFDPPGIGATTLRESFLIQLEIKGLKTHHAYQIVHNQFEDLVQGSLSLDQATKEALSSLHFAPGSSFSHHPIQSIRADVIVEESGGKFNVTISEEGVPDFHLSSTYSENIAPSYIRQKTAEGKWLYRILTRRNHILQQITHYLIVKQPGYFSGRESIVHPINLKETAEDLQMNPSTISRALSEKYLLCRHGLIPMKTFFPRKITMKDGRTISLASAKELLKKLIAKENKQQPLSDQLLAMKIQELGIPCARRTITKYRKELLIPSSHQRKISLSEGCFFPKDSKRQQAY